jgi:hypothetical protein
MRGKIPQKNTKERVSMACYAKADGVSEHERWVQRSLKHMYCDRLVDPIIPL